MNSVANLIEGQVWAETNLQTASIRPLDSDGDSQMDSDSDSDVTTSGTPSASQSNPTPAPASAPGSGVKASPIPPSFTSIGSPAVPTHEELQQMRMPTKGSAPDQLTPTPQGDEYPAVAKVEGLLDKSEASL